jgi:hypothetical protein
MEAGARLINVSSSGDSLSNVDLEDPNFEKTPYALTRPLHARVVCASERVELLPSCERRERMSLRRSTRAGMQLHLARGPSCSGNGRQAGDELLLKRVGSCSLRLVTVFAKYVS